MFSRFGRSAVVTPREEGQALVEYALILTLVTVVALGSLTLMGTDVNAFLDAIANALGAIPLP